MRQCRYNKRPLSSKVTPFEAFLRWKLEIRWWREAQFSHWPPFLHGVTVTQQTTIIFARVDHFAWLVFVVQKMFSKNSHYEAEFKTNLRLLTLFQKKFTDFPIFKPCIHVSFFNAKMYQNKRTGTHFEPNDLTQSSPNRQDFTEN